MSACSWILAGLLTAAVGISGAAPVPPPVSARPKLSQNAVQPPGVPFGAFVVLSRALFTASGTPFSLSIRSATASTSPAMTATMALPNCEAQPLPSSEELCIADDRCSNAFASKVCWLSAVFAASLMTL